MKSRLSWWSLAVGASALIPRLATAGTFQTTDETLWISRSRVFSDGLIAMDPSQMSVAPNGAAAVPGAATMPGVTTMWIGSLGRFLWAGADLVGLRSGDLALTQSRSAMAFTHVVMALVTSLLIAVFVLVASRWCGTVAAATAGLLLATEPFVVAHGSLLHTDELTMLFGINGSLLVLLAMERSGETRSRRLEIAAGVMLACAALTKVSAGALVPGLVVVLVADLWSRRATPSAARAAGRRVAVIVAVAVVMFVAAWPAMWVDPVLQMRTLWRSASQALGGRPTFFQGQLTTQAHPTYYLVTAPLRMTPWFLLGLLLIPFAAARAQRARLAVLAVLALPAAVIISSSPKLYDRYVLIIVPHLALAIGMGLDVLRRSLLPLSPATRWWPVAAGSAAAALTLHAYAIAPYGITYFNPLIGGSSRAERTMLVGWGEGLEVAGDVIADRQRGQCDVGVDVVGPRLLLMFPCQSFSPDAPLAYRVVYVSERQRLLAEGRNVPRRGVLVATVRVRGIDMVEIYDVRRGATVDAPPP